uniref:Transmembrane protein n=1 Tax=Panagrellus redivivus TaxID=6233 RepID=A0A7E4WCE6_PANRE
MTQRSVGRRLSRQHRWLRFLLRRRPCLYISIIEVLIVIVLSASIAGALYGFFHLRTARLKIQADDAKLEKLKNYITFAHCDYEEVTEFNELFCADRARKQAFAFRHHRLKEVETPDETCIDRHEQVDCHDEISDEDTILPDVTKLKTSVKQCAGLFESKINITRTSLNNGPIKAFALTRDDLKLHLGKVVHASELILQCPQCVLDAASFKFSDDDKYCYQHVTTESPGWPAFAADCEDLQETADSRCNVIGQ